jgi:acetyl-CoA synthetase
MKKNGYGTDRYEQMCESLAIDIPEYYNFGFDVVDAWAKKDRNKLALV